MCPGAQFNATLNTTTLNNSQKIHTLADFGPFSHSLSFLFLAFSAPSSLVPHLSFSPPHFEPDILPRPTMGLKWTIWQSDAMSGNIIQAGTKMHYAGGKSPGKFLGGATTDCRANSST